MQSTPALIVTGDGLDNSLPAPPGYPSHPIAGHPSHPIDPGFGVGLPPVASHPLPPSPGHPDQGLPTYPVKPGHDLPTPPSVWPVPPHPPIGPDQGLPQPIAPGFPIYLPPTGPDNELPLPPGAVWPPLPPSVTGEVLCFVWVVGVGYRWTVIDTALKPGMPLPPTTVPPTVDNTLPPTPEPKA